MNASGGKRAGLGAAWTETTVIEFDGYVHFQAWYGLLAPEKYALDTKYSDLEVVIGPDEQVLRGTHTGYLRTAHNDKVQGAVAAEFAFLTVDRGQVERLMREAAAAAKPVRQMRSMRCRR